MSDDKQNEIIRYQSPGQLLTIAIQKDFDLERLSKLMDLQERWEKSEAKKAFVQAMTEFKENPPKIIKDMHVEFQAGGHKVKYNHASLGNIVGTLTEALSKHQMSVNWDIKQQRNELKQLEIEVTCKITHIKGHSESTSITAPPDTTGTKNSIQAIGSTTTYLQRYTLLAVCGLATNEFETDGRLPENGSNDKNGKQPIDKPAIDPELHTKQKHIGNMLMQLWGNDKDKASQALFEYSKSDDPKYKQFDTVKAIKSVKQANFLISKIEKDNPDYDWKEFKKSGTLTLKPEIVEDMFEQEPDPGAEINRE